MPRSLTQKPKSSSPSKRNAKSVAVSDTQTSPPTSPKRGSAGRAGKVGTRRGKYNAAGERVDGIFFHSKSESVRYLQLKALRDDNVIDNLELQPSFDCLVNNIKVCAYRADFRYDIIDDRGYSIRTVVEDVKGMITPEYRIKKKLVEACYDMKVIEIPAKDVLKWADKTP